MSEWEKCSKVIPSRIDGGSSTRNPPVYLRDFQWPNSDLVFIWNIIHMNPYDSQDDGQWQVLKTLIKWWTIWKMKGFLCHFWWEGPRFSKKYRIRCSSGAAGRERHLDRCFEGREPVSWRGRFWFSNWLKMKGQRRDQTRENPRLIPSLALVSLVNHAIFAFKILRMKQEEIMRIEMEMKEALQDEQLRNQETAKYHKISTIYRPSVTLGQSMFLRFACGEMSGRYRFTFSPGDSWYAPRNRKDQSSHVHQGKGHAGPGWQAQVARNGIVGLTVWICA